MSGLSEKAVADVTAFLQLHERLDATVMGRANRGVVGGQDLAGSRRSEGQIGGGW